MATVINNPSDGGSGAGTIIGIVIAIILIALLFIYGLPALRGGAAPSGGGASVNVSLPSGDSGGTGGGQ